MGIIRDCTGSRIMEPDLANPIYTINNHCQVVPASSLDRASIPKLTTGGAVPPVDSQIPPVKPISIVRSVCQSHLL